jgi:ligand-binding sensor domain-containing protein
MKKFLTSFFFLFISASGLIAQSVQFKNLTINNGLLSSTIYCIIQDSKGFIWYSTPNGVGRYDGTTFENFTTDNGLSDNEVYKIKEDAKGRIWFLTSNGKLSYYLDGIISNPKNNKVLEKAICHSTFMNFHEDKNHTLWFSTNFGEVVAITNEKVEFQYRDQENFTLSNLVFFEDAQRTLWASNNVRFYKIINHKFIASKQIYYPSKDHLTYYSNENKTFYFVAKESLVAMQNGIQKIVKKLPNDILNKGLIKILVENNKLWASFIGNGIKVYDLNTSKEEGYLSDQSISSVLLDKDGNLWASSMENGLFFLSKKAANFINYTQGNPLTEEAVFSIIKDPEDNIWLGLKNATLNILQKDQTKPLVIHTNEINNKPIRKIIYNKLYHSVWAMNSSQIVSFPFNNFKSISSSTRQFSFSIKGFDMNSKGNLAIASSANLTMYNLHSKASNFFKAKNDEGDYLIKNRAFCLVYDKNDALWYDQLDGLHILKTDGKIYSFPKNTPVLNDRIAHFLCDSTGLVYASTSSNGVAIFKDYKLLRVINTKDGLNSNNCIKTYVADHQLWVLTDKGVNKIENPLSDLKIKTYNIQNGLLTNEVNDILIDDEHIYIASNKGLTKIPKSAEKQPQKPLALYFKKFLVGGKEYKITDKEIELSYWENNISIGFTAINFEEPGETLYQYKIKDSDDWVETKNTSLEFASLSPGDYNIQIRAKKIGELWGKGIKIGVFVNTPFYKSTLFIILIVLLSTIIIFLGYNKYTNIKRKIETGKLLNKAKIVALEQQALQAMMNPHFIFNVMNSIQYFINKEEKNTANMLLTGFARLIRKNLDIVNKGEISLEEEIEYLNLYLKLECLRFGEKLNYNITIDPELETEETFIPSMLLQPFIENAIWHGIMPNDGKGNIAIGFTLKHKLLMISIADDGIGIDNSLKIKNDEYISRGMTITKERIKLMNQLTGEEMTLQIKQQEIGGTLVEISIPILKD